MRRRCRHLLRQLRPDQPPLIALRAPVPEIAYAWERAIPFLLWTIIPYWLLNFFYARFRALAAFDQAYNEAPSLHIILTLIVGHYYWAKLPCAQPAPVLVCCALGYSRSVAAASPGCCAPVTNCCRFTCCSPHAAAGDAAARRADGGLVIYIHYECSAVCIFWDVKSGRNARGCSRAAPPGRRCASSRAGC